jgi:hypothetical protein
VDVYDVLRAGNAGCRKELKHKRVLLMERLLRICGKVKERHIFTLYMLYIEKKNSFDTNTTAIRLFTYKPATVIVMYVRINRF